MLKVVFLVEVRIQLNAEDSTEAVGTEISATKSKKYFSIFSLFRFQTAGNLICMVRM